MYVGVDVGGTKTLIAVFDGHGEILEQVKIPTNKNYEHFLLEVRHAMAHLKNKDFKAAGVAAPGTLDRRHNRVLWFGNLPWKNVDLQHDLSMILHCPTVVENDAKLAALSEAQHVAASYHKVLYVTLSTGIGLALVVDGTIDTNIADAGGRTMVIEHQGKRVGWEDLISGRAVVRRFGKRAEDITSTATWRTYSRDVAKCLLEVISMTQPDVVVFGGSVGNYFERYGGLLEDELTKYHLPLTTLPHLRKAQRPETAVVYGCYDFAKRSFSHAEVA